LKSCKEEHSRCSRPLCWESWTKTNFFFFFLGLAVRVINKNKLRKNIRRIPPNYINKPDDITSNDNSPKSEINIYDGNYPTDNSSTVQSADVSIDDSSAHVTAHAESENLKSDAIEINTNKEQVIKNGWVHRFILFCFLSFFSSNVSTTFFSIWSLC